jgi:hypothetical protein
MKKIMLGFVVGVLVMWMFAAFIGFYQVSTIKGKPFRVNKLTGKVEAWDGSRWEQMR